MFSEFHKILNTRYDVSVSVSFLSYTNIFLPIVCGTKDCLQARYGSVIVVPSFMCQCLLVSYLNMHFPLFSDVVLLYTSAVIVFTNKN